MKRNILFALCAIVLGVAGYVGYQQVSASSESDLFLANVEALSEEELSSDEKNRQKECFENDGEWNMASICVDGGVETVTSDNSKELHLFGAVIKVSKKNTPYVVKWERYECQDHKHSCCETQGVDYEVESL